MALEGENNMAISLATRMRALFARDEYEYWFNHFTDEEKKLKKMSIWQLAEVINEANVHNNNPVKKIVAEHALSHRLAKLQANASWGSSFVGIGGVIAGAILSSWLSSAPFKERQNVAESKTEITKQSRNETEKQTPIN